MMGAAADLAVYGGDGAFGWGSIRREERRVV